MVKGIDQNFHPESVPDGFVFWAKNGLNNNKLDASINEKGNKIDIDISILDLAFKNGITTLGNIIIIFGKDNSNRDVIITINEITKVITTKLVTTEFNFQVNYPITAVAKLNSKNQLIVEFGDGFNTDKYVNLDTVNISDPLNFYNLFPLVTNPNNIELSILNSGAVTTGAHIFTFQYIAKDRSRSSWTTLSNPIYVTNIDNTQPYTSTKGINSGQSSNKSIKGILDNIDITYEKVAIAVISKVNGVISSKIIKEIYITTTNLTFIYNGTENIGTVTIDELVADNVIYNSAKHRIALNDQLFLADLTVPIIENFQHIANQTVIRWRSTLDNTNTITQSSLYKDGNRKTHIHDEVVPFYIQFELLNGSFTSWYHVPGRLSNTGDTNPSGLATGGLQINGRTPKKYEIEDTCVFDTTNGDGSKSGSMGFWQNENEVYPSNFADYAGQQVRHHKFPSIEYMYESVWGGTNYGIDRLDFLNIEVINTAWDTTKIKGYRIGYAQKSLSDISVLGIGLTKFSGNSSHFASTTLFNTGGNFIQNCIDSGDSGDTMNPNLSYLRFNSFDIWQDRPAVDNSYLRNYIKLKANKLANGDPYIPSSDTYGLISAGKFFDADSALVAYISNYTIPDPGDNTRVISSTIISGDKIRKLTSQTYVPHGVKFIKDSIIIDNRGSEETIHAQIQGAPLNIATYGTLKCKTAGQFVDLAMEEETYLSSLKNPKSDFYIDYENKTIVVNPIIIRNKTNQVIFSCGDGFLGMHSYATLAGFGGNNYLDFNKSIVMFNAHIGVSRHNVNLRYLKDGDYSSYFYSDAGLFINRNPSDITKSYWFSPFQYSRASPFNAFLYSKDFSYVNSLEVFGVFNPININQNDNRFSIIRSTKATTENALDDGWRTFKAIDIFNTVRDKGYITNLVAWGTDALIIHHQRAIYRTRDKAVLQTDITNITLGSGDLFAVEPREVNSTPTGTGGTQHKFSCLLTDLGYFFIDEETKDVYLYDGGTELKDIRKGLFRFFQDNLNCKIDNPFNDQGLMIAFDNQNNRILLSQKADISFTLSYDIVNQEWAYAHDFIPDYMFNTRNNVYSFQQQQLYTHNIGDKGKYYGIVYPFYIDFIVNEQAGIEKVLEDIRWLTKYKLSDTSINARKTITSITIWNDQACTGKINIITNETNSLFIYQNTKQVGEKWSFNEIYDTIIDPTQPFVTSLLSDSRPIGSNLTPPVWYDALPLRGKYFIVRLEYDNIDNKELHLRELYPSIRKSNK